ncbi:MAG TPA: hypothetical protein VK454_11440, partial [Myxococcaceae bacterium]|nr:hypothetical protein [Myxococcaceae bacterium]
MSLVVVGAALGAAALLTWLQLRPAGSGRAVAVPSVQHLSGTSPARRRAPPLEEPVAFSLRVAALLLAVLGVWCARSGCSRDAGAVAVVDPEAISGACARARAEPGVATVLCFEGDAPDVTGEDAGRLALLLSGCSDTRTGCLLRVAEASGRPLFLLGAFDSAGWAPALARLGRGFSFLRQSPSGHEPPPTPPLRLPSARLQREGTSASAWVWAAALEEASERGRDGEGPLIVVQDADRAAGPWPGAALTINVAEAPAPARPGSPAVEARPGRGLLLPDPLDLAARTPGLGLRMSLALLPDARFEALLPILAVRHGGAGNELAVAASPEDLARWAHEGRLLPLARALLAAGLPPAVALGAPAGGALGWSSADGQQAPVGLLDVAPGLYRRSDARAVLPLERTRIPGLDPLDDAALVRLGGRPWTGAGARPPPWATLLLGAACLLWLAGVAATWRIRRAWPPALAAAALLCLFAGGAAFSAELVAPWIAALRIPPGAEADHLGALLRKTPVDGRSGDVPCAAPGALPPCTLVATVGLASSPPAGADALVFDASRPRVDLVSVEAPSEVPLGSAAEVWATVRVRRAPGRPVLVTARSTSAAPVSGELTVEAADGVATVRLAVAPLHEGISFVAVEVRIAGEPQAQDARLLAVAARARSPRRTVLAASPGWEARAAAEALETTGARVEVQTLLGTRAVAARGRGAVDPRQLLRETTAGPDGLDLLVLVGFSERDLDPAAAAGLRGYLEAGGGALLLESPAAARALGIELPPVPAAGAERSLLGRLEAGTTLPLRGFAPAVPLSVPPGTAVLGRLEALDEASPAPWLLGRAVGKGRVAVVTAPDLWRLSPPGQGREAYQGL